MYAHHVECVVLQPAQCRERVPVLLGIDHCFTSGVILRRNPLLRIFCTLNFMNKEKCIFVRCDMSAKHSCWLAINDESHVGRQNPACLCKK